MSKQVLTMNLTEIGVNNHKLGHKKVVLSPRAKEKKRAYDKEYARKYFKGKYIPFNTQFPEDIELLEWVQIQENGTQYIKRLIREDMMRQMIQEGEKDGIYV